MCLFLPWYAINQYILLLSRMTSYHPGQAYREEASQDLPMELQAWLMRTIKVARRRRWATAASDGKGAAGKSSSAD
jgi:hypothetical protein